MSIASHQAALEATALAATADCSQAATLLLMSAVSLFGAEFGEDLALPMAIAILEAASVHQVADHAN